MRIARNRTQRRTKKKGMKVIREDSSVVCGVNEEMVGDRKKMRVAEDQEKK